MNYELEYLQVNYNNNMENGIFKLNWVNVKSALIYGLIFGLVAVVGYMLKVGTVFALDWHILVDSFVFGFLGSVIKNLLTTSEGNFVGLVKVIPKTK